MGMYYLVKCFQSDKSKPLQWINGELWRRIRGGSVQNLKHF
jgi:hypothetical protein